VRFVLVVRIYLIYNEINVRGGGMMEGNERRKQMTKVLYATLAAAPVTAERLAKMFSVSVRTVRYDLDVLSEDLRSEG